MRGHVVWLAVALMAAGGLAGCSGKATVDVNGESVTADFSTVDVTVSATTGAIRGVVVDPSVRPVPDAAVALSGKGPKVNATTDKGGLFAFSNLEPGTYFVSVAKPLFKNAQTSVEVRPGVEPPVTKIQIEPLFSQKPFTVQVERKGFFECSQAGIGLYSSSNCVTDYCPVVQPPKTCSGLPTNALNNITNQNREWHSDVLPGWQQMVFEMTWDPTAQGTSDRMGMVVSTYKPERNTSHSFANVAAKNPLRIELDVGKKHATAASTDPTEVPPDGMSRMSYFVSVRPPEGSTCVLDCVPPGLAINQDFQVFLTQFYYGVPKANWSVVGGDAVPF